MQGFNFRYLIIYKNQYNLRYSILMKCFKLAFIYIQKSWQFALREFLYTQIRTLRKKQDNLRYVFNIQKSWHFASRDFSWNLWNWRRRGAFLITKNNALCVKFLYAKNNALCVTFLFTKILTLCVTFLNTKNNALFVTFYISNLS